MGYEAREEGACLGEESLGSSWGVEVYVPGLSIALTCGRARARQCASDLGCHLHPAVRLWSGSLKTDDDGGRGKKEVWTAQTTICQCNQIKN